MRAIIGLSGLPNAGKDVTANFLIRKYKYNKLSMAQPIREVVYGVFNLDTNFMNDREYESKPLPELGGKTVKIVLQEMGKLGTDIYDSVWVNATFRDLDTALRQRWVVADVRRPCEMEKIQGMGGLCFYIHSNRPIPDDGRDMGHESESYHNYLRTNANYHLLNDHETVDEYLSYVGEYMNNVMLEEFILCGIPSR